MTFFNKKRRKPIHQSKYRNWIRIEITSSTKFERPLFLLPCGVYRRAVLSIELVDIRRTWPSHCHLRFYMTSAIGLMPVRFLRSSLDIVFGQKILIILRRHLFWNTSNFCSMVVVVFQHSTLYNKTLRMLLLNIFNLVFSFMLTSGWSLALRRLVLL